MKSRKVYISIRIDSELNRILQDLSDKTQRTKSFYIVEAIEKHIKELSDYYSQHGNLPPIKENN